MTYICLDKWLNENASHPNLHNENYTEVTMVYLCILNINRYYKNNNYWIIHHVAANPTISHLKTLR